MVNLVCSGVDSSISTDEFTSCNAASNIFMGIELDLNPCILDHIIVKNPCDWMRAEANLRIYHNTHSNNIYLGGRDPLITTELHEAIAKILAANSALHSLSQPLNSNLDLRKTLDMYVANTKTNKLLGGATPLYIGASAASFELTEEELKYDKALVAENSKDMVMTYQEARDYLHAKYEESINSPDHGALSPINPNKLKCKNPDSQEKYSFSQEVKDNALTITSSEYLRIADFNCLVDPESYPTKTITKIVIKAAGFAIDHVSFSKTLESLVLIQTPGSTEYNYINQLTVKNLEFAGSTILFADTNKFNQSLSLNLTNKEGYCSFYQGAVSKIYSKKFTINEARSCIAVGGIINADETTIKSTGKGNVLHIEKNAYIKAGSEFKVSISVFLNDGKVNVNNIAIAQETLFLNNGELYSIHSNIAATLLANFLHGIFRNHATATITSDHIYNLGLINIGQLIQHNDNDSSAPNELFYNNGKLELVNTRIKTKAFVNRDRAAFIWNTELIADVVDNIGGNVIFTYKNVLIEAAKLIVEPAASTPSAFDKTNSKFNTGSSVFALSNAVEAVFNVDKISVVSSIFRSQASLSFTKCPEIAIESLGKNLNQMKNSFVHLENANIVCSQLKIAMEAFGRIGSADYNNMLQISDAAYGIVVPDNVRSMDPSLLQGADYNKLMALINRGKVASNQGEFTSVTVDTSVFMNTVYLYDKYVFTMMMLGSKNLEQVKYIEIFKASPYLSKHDSLVVDFQNNADPKTLSDVVVYESTPEGIKSFLSNIGYTTNAKITTTGAFFEKSLIERSLLNLIGLQKIEGTIHIQTQISRLYSNAKAAYHLFGPEIMVVGKELPADLVEKLGASVIWPVFKSVKLPNGFEENVLFPTLYLLKKDLFAAAKGAVLSIENTNLVVNSNFINYNTIVMQDAFMRINGDFINAGRFIGSGELEAKNVLQLGEITNIDQFKLIADNFASPAFKKRIATGNGYYEVELEAGNKFRMYGAFELNVKDTLILQKPDAVFGAKTKIDAGRFIIVPLQLSAEAWHSYTTGGGFLKPKTTHNSHDSSIKHKYGHIEANDEFIASAHENMMWVGVNTQASKGDITLQSLANMLVATLNDVSQHDASSHTKGFLGTSIGKKSHSHGNYASTPIPMYIKTDSGIIRLNVGEKDANGNVITNGNVVVIGTDLKATQVHVSVIGEGTPALVPARALKYSYEEFKRSTLFKSSDDGHGFMLAGEITTKSATTENTYRPTVVQVEELFYVSAPNGTYVQAASHVISDGKVVIEAKNILVNPEEQAVHTAHEYSVIGAFIKAQANSKEVSIGGGTAGKIINSGQASTRLARPIIYAKSGIDIECSNNGTSVFMAAIIKTEGALISRCTNQNFLDAFETDNGYEKSISLSLMAKMGVRSNYGGAVDGANRVSSGVKQGGGDGAINTAFGLLNLYNGVQNVAKNGLFTAGAWIESDIKLAEKSSRQSTPVPTEIQAGTFISYDEVLTMVGTHIEAISAVFKNKKLNIDASLGRYLESSSSFALSAMIPMGGGAPSVNVGAGEAEQEVVRRFNAKIFVAEHLSFEIEGEANLNGVSIRAASIEAAIDKLVFSSVQDYITSNSFGINVGTDSIGGSIGKYDSARVREISTMIATNPELGLKIKARMLELNGAMIASAAVAEDGSLTDLGNLTLMVGTFIHRHIHDYEDGENYGVSVATPKNIGQKSDGSKENAGIAESTLQLSDVTPQDIGTVQIGVIKANGQTLAVVGSGNIVAGEIIGGELARDVNHAQTYIKETNIQIDAKIQKLASKDELTDLSNLDKNIVNAFKQNVGSLEQQLNFVISKISEAFTSLFIPNDQHSELQVINTLKLALDTAKKNPQMAVKISELIQDIEELADLPDQDNSQSNQDNSLSPDPDYKNYKHGKIGAYSDKAAAWIDNKLEALIDTLFEVLHYIGDSQNEFSELLNPHDPASSQPIKDAVSEGTEFIGKITYNTAKVLYTATQVDGLNSDDSFVLMNEVNKYSKEFDNGAVKLAKIVQDNTTYGERRLAELGLTALGVGKVGHDYIKYGELFGHRHIVGGKLDTKILASELNHRLSSPEFVGKAFTEPPYGGKKYALIYHTDKIVEGKFVRLFNDEVKLGFKSERHGAFVMRETDLMADIGNGLTIPQIADKYGLPNIPTKIVGTKFEPGTKMAVGEAAPIKFSLGDGSSVNRAGGGRQYQILQYPQQEWFPKDTVKDLNQYIKEVK